MRRSAVLAIAGVAVLIAGCGSTAAPRAGTAPGTQVDDGLAAPEDASGSADEELGVSDPSGAGSNSGGSTTGDGSSSGLSSGGSAFGSSNGSGSSGSGTGGSSTSGSSGGTSTAAARQGVGVTAKTISIGVVYTESAEAANAAFGVDLASGDTKANAQAVIDDINARGGVAGRKLIPVFHAYDAESSETKAAQDQAACENLTQDHKVFAVVGSGYTPTWDGCMAKAGVLNVQGATLTDEDREAFAAKPHYVNVNAPMRDRVESALVPALVRQSYFTGWDSAQGAPGTAKPVVGIIGYNVPEYERPLTKILLPKLKAAGHPVLPENIARITAPQSSAEQGPAIAEVGNTVLRFRQNGVTHLILIDTGGGLTLVFTAAAKNQNYYPRLGVTSGSGLQGLYDAGTFGDRELAGAVGLGWSPSIDLPSAAGDTYANSETRRCLAVLKQRTGQEYATTNEASIALGQCDEINLVSGAIRQAGNVINLSTGMAAIERLGGSLLLASLPAHFFGPDRHDGAELGWDMVWDTPCKCAKYIGAARAMR